MKRCARTTLCSCPAPGLFSKSLQDWSTEHPPSVLRGCDKQATLDRATRKFVQLPQQRQTPSASFQKRGKKSFCAIARRFCASRTSGTEWTKRSDPRRQKGRGTTRSSSNSLAPKRRPSRPRVTCRRGTLPRAAASLYPGPPVYQQGDKFPRLFPVVTCLIGLIYHRLTNLVRNPQDLDTTASIRSVPATGRETLSGMKMQDTVRSFATWDVKAAMLCFRIVDACSVRKRFSECHASFGKIYGKIIQNQLVTYLCFVNFVHGQTRVVHGNTRKSRFCLSCSSTCTQRSTVARVKDNLFLWNS